MVKTAAGRGGAGLLGPERYRGAHAGIGVRRLADSIGAEITDVDLSRPITQEEYLDINQALVDHSVIVFRSQDLPPAMHVDFASRFGRLVGHIVKRFSVTDFPEVTHISNVVDDKGEKIGADRAGMVWHSDMSYFPRPMLGSMLYGVECPPEGADTEFASTWRRTTRCRSLFVRDWRAFAACTTMPGTMPPICRIASR